MRVQLSSRASGKKGSPAALLLCERWTTCYGEIQSVGGDGESRITNREGAMDWIRVTREWPERAGNTYSKQRCLTWPSSHCPS